MPARADQLAEQCWRAWGGRIERHAADWARHGRAAGLRRNAGMVAAGAEVCLAFICDSSPGASYAARTAESAGIPHPPLQPHQHLGECGREEVRTWRCRTGAARSAVRNQLDQPSRAATEGRLEMNVAVPPPHRHVVPCRSGSNTSTHGPCRRVGASRSARCPGAAGAHPPD